MLGQRQPAEPHGDPRRQDGEVEPPPREQAEAARDAQNLDDAHCLAPGGCCRRILPCADAGRNGGMTSWRRLGIAGAITDIHALPTPPSVVPDGAIHPPTLVLMRPAPPAAPAEIVLAKVPPPQALL